MSRLFSSKFPAQINFHLFGLVLITLLAYFLRFYRLGEWGFGGDEVFTLNNALTLPQNLTNDFLFALSEHPVSASLILLNTKIFGISEWSARFVPALLGTMTIPLMYVPIKRFFDSDIALVTVSILAVSSWHITWSQNTRFYILLLIFYTLGFLLFLQGLSTGQRKYFVFCLLFLGLAVSERLLGILLVPTFVTTYITLLLLPVEKPTGLKLSNLLIILFPGFVLVPFFGWQFIQNPSAWYDIYLQWVDKGPFEFLAEFVRHVDVLTFGLGVLGAVLFWEKRTWEGVAFIVGAVIVPVLVALAAMIQFVSVRYAFVSLISWYILAAGAVVELVKSTAMDRRYLTVGMILLMLMIGPARENLRYFSSVNGQRNNWKAAFEFVESERKPGDLVASTVPHVGVYYLGDQVLEVEEVDPRIVPDQIVRNRERVWFVVGGKGRIDPVLNDWIQANSQLVYDDGAGQYIWIYPTQE